MVVVEEGITDGKRIDLLVEYFKTMGLGDLTPESHVSLPEDPEIEHILKNYPANMADRMIRSAWKRAVCETKAESQAALVTGKTESMWGKVGLEYTDYFSVRMGEINPGMEGKKIKFSCMINGLEEKHTYYKTALFVCDRCGIPLEVHCDDMYETKIPKCEKCHIDMKVDTTAENDVESIRFARVEEPMEQSLGLTPQRYTAILKGKDAEMANYGQRWNMIAIFKSVMVGGKRKYNDIYLDILSMENIDTCKEDLPTEEELSMLKREAQSEDFLNKVIESYTNKIGLGDEKLACLLSLAKGDVIPDVIRRDDIHVLFMGNPSTAKSELLQFGHEITPRSIASDGGNTGKVGIRGGIETLSNGAHVFVPGTMSQANGSHLYFDELDKMPKEDMPSMYRGMEQQWIEYDKVIHARLPSDTSVIAAANPKNGYYDDELTLQQNFNIPFALQSRFDLIFFIDSISDESKLDKIGSQARGTYRWEPFISKELMMRYINYVKRLHPTLPDKVAEKIQKYWVKVKMQSMKQTDGIKIEPRHLQGLIRIAFAFAKLQFHEEVTDQDADNSIGIFQRSLKSLGQDLETGTVQGVLTPTAHENQQSAFMRITNEVFNKSETGIIEPIDLYDALIRAGIFNQFEVEEKVAKLKDKMGMFIVTWNGKFKISR